jgi:hypothetical protein
MKTILIGNERAENHCLKACTVSLRLLVPPTNSSPAYRYPLSRYRVRVGTPMRVDGDARFDTAKTTTVSAAMSTTRAQLTLSQHAVLTSSDFASMQHTAELPRHAEPGAGGRGGCRLIGCNSIHEGPLLRHSGLGAVDQSKSISTISAPIRYGPGETSCATSAIEPDPAFSRGHRLCPPGLSPPHRRAI